MSGLILTDAEIERLLALPKRVTNPGARKKVQRGSELVNFDVSAEGADFRLYVRQNTRLANAFSCGLLYVAPSGDTVTLTRYNGSDHPHSNPLDSGGMLPMSFHIHRATNRYMTAGRKPEHFAESTDRYTDLNGALLALLRDCKIEGLEGPPSSPQFNLL